MPATKTKVGVSQLRKVTNCDWSATKTLDPFAHAPEEEAAEAVEELVAVEDAAREDEAEDLVVAEGPVAEDPVVAEGPEAVVPHAATERRFKSLAAHTSSMRKRVGRPIRWPNQNVGNP